MKKVIYFLIIIMLIGVILISIYFIYKELKQNKEQENTFNDLIKIVESSSDDKGNENEENNINLNKLYEINNDLVGWIKINNTNINYPVMQSKNSPNYYLKRNFYKKYSSYGTPYLSEQCNIDTSINNIIYGHNMKNKKMFGTLESYKKEDFYNKHQIIIFNTLKKCLKYQIFAVFKTTVYNNNGFKYYNYIDFQNEEDYNDFIDKCKTLSFYETNKKPEYKNKLLTLSTCEYSNKNGRLVIIAYEVND